MSEQRVITSPRIDFASDAYRAEIMGKLFDGMRFLESRIEGFREFPTCWRFGAHWPMRNEEAKLTARRVWAMNRILLAWLHETFGEPGDLISEGQWAYRFWEYLGMLTPGGVTIFFCSRSDVAKFKLFFDTRPCLELKSSI